MRDAPPPYGVRWTYHPGYPAPAWAFEVPSWPLRAEVQTPALPMVRVWWSPDLESAPSAAVERGPMLKTLLGLSSRTLPLDGDNVVIEGVQVEQHYVETKPGARELKSCLVVRMSHGVGRPVRVQVRGVRVEGQEHRYYADAGKYTGIFWPVTEEQANELQSLGVISVNAFKREAEQRGYYMQMDKLGPPTASDVRPQPSFELK